jgi:hypothetical protein
MTHFLWVEDFNASENQKTELINPAENIVRSTIMSVFGKTLNLDNDAQFNKKVDNQYEVDDQYDARDFLEEKGIFLKLNLLDALKFIRNPKELAKIDFVVLDVDMLLKQDNKQKDDNNYLPDLIKEYGSESELSRIAGYPIYIELVMELGFPKSHILFCSNHAKYFETLNKKFENAK